ncbi:MAG: hypothetical protein ACTSXS_08295 [Candidatus Thorarchaeota archaeon]
MKRALNVLLALSVITMFLVSPVAAATSQGLEWGFAKGDKWDFTLKVSSEKIDEQIYANITNMPVLAIPDPLTSWDNIPFPTVGMYWANGTDIGLMALLFIGLVAVGSRMTVPIGNYTLLTELVSTKLTGETMIDTATEWGITWKVSTNSTHEQRITATYLKTDGFLAQYKWEQVISASNTVVDSISVIRNNLPSGGFDFSNITQLLKDNILYVGAGVAVLVILAIVCKKR